MRQSFDGVAPFRVVAAMLWGVRLAYEKGGQR